MTQIAIVVKNTLLQLNKQSTSATPDNYYKEFNIQAKIAKLKVKEIDIFDSIVVSLTKVQQEELKSQNIVTFSELSLFLLTQNSNLKGFSNLLCEILAPSIHNDIEEEITELQELISKDASSIMNRDTVSKIQDITKKRITNDRKVLKDKSEDLSKLLTLMSKYFSKTLIESESSSERISDIKLELEDLDISESSLREMGVVQTKLIDTLYTIENSMEESKAELQENKSQFTKLQKKIVKLQEDLDSATEEASLDHLTQVLNRRAFDKAIQKVETMHKMFGSHYAIVFYDIDFFKKINDNYGHACGDAILRTFAAILKKLSRKEDIVARYGGEEFIIVLHYQQEQELIRYIKRVKNTISDNIFSYKKDNIENIQIQFSAGVTRRDNYNTYQDTIKKADELLYVAKNTGRNKVILDDGKVFA